MHAVFEVISWANTFLGKGRRFLLLLIRSSSLMAPNLMFPLRTVLFFHRRQIFHKYALTRICV